MGRGQTPPPGQRSTRSSKARGSEPHGGCWVPLPTSDAAGALSRAGRTEGSETELDLGCPLPQAAQGIPRPLLPQAQPHPRAGQGPGQQAARGRIRAGSSSQPPSRWVFLSLFPVSTLPAVYHPLLFFYFKAINFIRSGCIVFLKTSTFNTTALKFHSTTQRQFFLSSLIFLIHGHR